MEAVTAETTINPEVEIKGGGQGCDHAGTCACIGKHKTIPYTGHDRRGSTFLCVAGGTDLNH